jgi:hypothetical protein
VAGPTANKPTRRTGRITRPAPGARFMTTSFGDAPILTGGLTVLATKATSTTAPAAVVLIRRQDPRPCDGSNGSTVG